MLGLLLLLLLLSTSFSSSSLFILLLYLTPSSPLGWEDNVYVDSSYKRCFCSSCYSFLHLCPPVTYLHPPSYSSLPNSFSGMWGQHLYLLLAQKILLLLVLITVLLLHIFSLLHNFLYLTLPLGYEDNAYVYCWYKRYSFSFVLLLLLLLFPILILLEIYHFKTN